MKAGAACCRVAEEATGKQRIGQHTLLRRMVASQQSPNPSAAPPFTSEGQKRRARGGIPVGALRGRRDVCSGRSQVTHKEVCLGKRFEHELCKSCVEAALQTANAAQIFVDQARGATVSSGRVRGLRSPRNFRIQVHVATFRHKCGSVQKPQ